MHLTSLPEPKVPTDSPEEPNFLVGVWGLAAGRERVGSDASAVGFSYLQYDTDSNQFVVKPQYAWRL